LGLQCPPTYAKPQQVFKSLQWKDSFEAIDKESKKSCSKGVDLRGCSEI